MRLKTYLMLVLSVLTVIGLVMVPGCAGEVETPAQKIEDISAQDAYDLIQDNIDNQDFIILDVRTPEEYDEGHVEGAINVNYNAPNFSDLLDIVYKDRTYLIYCRSGRRSAGALALMEEKGFLEIYHMNGGMLEWAAEDLPMVE